MSDTYRAAKKALIGQTMQQMVALGQAASLCFIFAMVCHGLGEPVVHFPRLVRAIQHAGLILLPVGVVYDIWLFFHARARARQASRDLDRAVGLAGNSRWW